MSPIDKNVKSHEKLFSEILLNGAREIHISLPNDIVGMFEKYMQELRKWNSKINITRIHDDLGIVVKHFIDSISPSRYIPSYASILDIGSGGGFPGIPLKIVNPTIRVTLLESTLKKVNFQKHIIRVLKLDKIVAIHGRAEDHELYKRIDLPFDVVISRAFSDLKNFLEVAEPYVKRRGRIIAMRGRDVREEILENKEKIENLKLQVDDVNEFYLPYVKEKRSIIVFSKNQLR
ncbi:MAG: 16S rRNA (guanine(527)-N(7))-methyltransferase RsmG [Thermodesulfobacteriota bacterium]|nr:16S rRNA (guanine(527)-N(7))-methyltransferase RsmG [Thermodesulfobacteriota bacterium]